MSEVAESAAGGSGQGKREHRKQELMTQISGLKVRTDEQHSYVEGMRYILSTTFMSTDASREALLEMFPPDVLLLPSCLKFPLLFRFKRDVLQFVGIPVESRQGLYIPQAVAHALYSTDNVLKITGNRYISDYKHAADSAMKSTSVTAPMQDTSGVAPDFESAWRRLDAANRRFSEAEKYSGILAESPNLSEARNGYLTYCSQKGFPREDRIKLVSCILKGPALNYWTLHIDGKPEFTELGSVFAKLESQFDTPAHQRQIESLALSLTMEDIRTKHNCSRIAALGNLYHEVSRLNQKFLKVKRGDEFRTQTLMKVVEKYEWSKTAEEDVMQDKIGYDALYTKLSGGVVIWENKVKRSGRDPDTTDDRRTSIGSSGTFVGYGAQYANPVAATRRPTKSTASSSARRAGYGRQPPTSASRRSSTRGFGTFARGFGGSARGRSVRFRTDNRIDTRCWKCGRLGHWRAECTFSDSNSMVSAARGRIRDIGGNPNEAAAQVLYELVTEEDMHNLAPHEEDNHFEALVATAKDHLQDTNEVADTKEGGEPDDERGTDEEDFHDAGEEYQ